MLFADSEPKPGQVFNDSTAGEQQAHPIVKLPTRGCVECAKSESAEGELRKTFHGQEPTDLLLYVRRLSPQALK